MNREIELHDSTFAGLTFDGPDAVVHLAPAYVHHSEGRPGFDEGTGWTQAIDLRIRNATVESSPTRFPSWLSDGVFSIGASRWDNGIPLPLSTSEAVSLSAITEHAETLLIRGAGAEAIPQGDPRYVEPGPGSAKV